MRLESGPTAIHASAIAINGSALLICGRSGAGKSSLAAALVRGAAAATAIELVGDDRVLLRQTETGGLTVRPHPRIAGFIERRGLGLVAMRHRDSAPVGGIVHLDEPGAAVPPLPHDLPTLVLAREPDVRRRGDAVLSWWRNRAAALGPQSAGKIGLTAQAGAKDYNYLNAST